MEVEKWAETAVSPEGQVLGGPDFTRVALKGFRTHTLLKTHKVSHAESQFSPPFLDCHFSGLKGSTKLAVDTALRCGHHPSEHKLQDVKQILEALKKSTLFKGRVVYYSWCLMYVSIANQMSNKFYKL